MQKINTQFLRKSVQVIILITTLFITSCNDDPTVQPIVQGTEIINVSFLKVNNPSLSNDIYLNQYSRYFYYLHC